MITYEEFKRYYDAGVHEPEFYVLFADRNEEYMIIKYADGPTFQRCGATNGSGEYKYPDLDALYCADTIDRINLKRDWDKIEDIYPNGYGNFEDYCSYWNIPINE